MTDYGLLHTCECLLYAVVNGSLCSPYLMIVSCQSQESLRLKAERIEELEEALRESVQMTAEREMVLAQEEAARTHQEKQVRIRISLKSHTTS